VLRSREKDGIIDWKAGYGGGLMKEEAALGRKEMVIVTYDCDANLVITWSRNPQSRLRFDPRHQHYWNE